MKLNRWVSLVLLLSLSLTVAGCEALTGKSPQATVLTASGAIAADEVNVGPEIGGKVVEVNIQEGESVTAGTILFRVDDAIVQAQRTQAQRAVDSAGAAVNTARAQLASAQAQLALALQGARAQDRQARSAAWSLAAPITYPAGFNLPNWYFDKAEATTATQTEVAAARAALTEETANLAKVLQDASNSDFVQTEQRLAAAQVQFTIATQTLAQAQTAQTQEALVTAAQNALDAARSAMTSAQLDYDRKLTTSAAQTVREARARVAVATARLNNAEDALMMLQTGEQALTVAAAQAGVDLAAQAVAQAEAGQAQAEAALALLTIQMDKTAVRAPITGIVLARNLAVGELVGAGSPVFVLGQLDQVRLTVYVAEDRYGQVKLGEAVQITVDSLPGQTFAGTVGRIADQAEFTPRNVQTVEGRKTTVYAVEIQVPNADHQLKPGMPADVTFIP